MLDRGEVDPAGYFWKPGDSRWTAVGEFARPASSREMPASPTVEGPQTPTGGSGKIAAAEPGTDDGWFSKGTARGSIVVGVAALLILVGWLWGSGSADSLDDPTATVAESSRVERTLATPTALGMTPRADGLHIEDALRAVVYIETNRGSGSGFIVDPKGWIVTNDHVIKGARRIHVGVGGEDAEIPAEVIAKWPELDLAVLSIEGGDLPFLPLGDPTAVEIGTEVYALGSPLGLRNSVSKGILSARRAEEGLELLQITAPVSPGSSGGPVLTANGEVLGVTVGYLSEGQNLNFAIPANYVYELLTNPDHGYHAETADSEPTATPRRRRASEFDTRGAPPVRPGPFAYRKHGSLSRTSDSFDSGHRYEVIPLTMDRNDRVRVRVTSEEFDPHLLVISPTGEVFENDDENDFSRAAEVETRSRASGEWVVVVTSFWANAEGSYELRIEKS